MDAKKLQVTSKTVLHKMMCGVSAEGRHFDGSSA
jgi:hypothetical protein